MYVSNKPVLAFLFPKNGSLNAKTTSFVLIQSDIFTLLLHVCVAQVGSMCELPYGPNLQRDFPGKDRKKAKVKKPATALPKPRTIKFHEYKVRSIS